MKSILVSGFFPPEKMPLFNSLAVSLRSQGIQIIFHEQTRQRNIDTAFEVIYTPMRWFSNPGPELSDQKSEYHNDGVSYHPETGWNSEHPLSVSHVYAALSHSSEKSGTTFSYSLRILAEYERFLEDIFSTRSICRVLMWHQFTGRNEILASVCRRKGVPFSFLEFGSLPGTIALDHFGAMGESEVARNPERVRSITVSDSELLETAEYLSFCRNQKSNRPLRNEEISSRDALFRAVERARVGKRKIVFFAGQNDWGSGILPDFPQKRRWHSPFYRSTKDALTHLAELAQVNDWHIIFKPHPYVTKHQAPRGEPEAQYERIVAASDHIDLVSNVDVFDCIALCDVCVTILSQTAYLALIQQKPTVVLGRMQLNTGEAAFLPPSRLAVQDSIREAVALSGELNNHRSDGFVKHCTQLLKFNLFRLGDQGLPSFARGLGDLSAQLVHDITRFATKHDRGMLEFDEQSDRRSGALQAGAAVTWNVCFSGYFVTKSTDLKKSAKRRFWLRSPSPFKIKQRFFENSEDNIDADFRHEKIVRFPKYFSWTDRFRKLSPCRSVRFNVNWLRENRELIDFLCEWEAPLFRKLHPELEEEKIRHGLIRSFVKLMELVEYSEFLNKTQLLITHSLTPVNYALRYIARAAGIPSVFSEFGEIPNSFLVSERSLFFDSWPNKEPKFFMSLPIEQRDLHLAKICTSNLVSVRLHSGRVEKSLNKQRTRPVIYVNGIHPLDSGLLPRSSELSSLMSPDFNSNADLLSAVMRLARKNDWRVIYREHPMLVRTLGSERNVSSDDEVLIDSSEMDFDAALAMADVMVSLSSKSIIAALVNGVPVVCPGPFTIPKGAVEPGFSSTTDLEAAISSYLQMDQRDRVNQTMLLAFFARLRKYYLYPFPGTEDAGTKKHSDLWPDILAFSRGERSRVSIPDP